MATAGRDKLCPAKQSQALYCTWIASKFMFVKNTHSSKTVSIPIPIPIGVSVSLQIFGECVHGCVENMNIDEQSLNRAH